MSPERVSDLEGASRRRAALHTAFAIVVAWVVVIAVYYRLPIGSHFEGDTFLRLAAGLALFGLALARQTRRVLRADLPELKAVETLGSLIPLFFVIFATIYLSLARASQSTFSEPLDHTKAIYFTITVFSTVGFGDITPKSDAARIVVSIQMLLDLVVLGAVIRVLTKATKASFTRSE